MVRNGWAVMVRRCKMRGVRRGSQGLERRSRVGLGRAVKASWGRIRLGETMHGLAVGVSYGLVRYGWVGFGSHGGSGWVAAEYSMVRQVRRVMSW
jgi:hypothetical protein